MQHLSLSTTGCNDKSNSNHRKLQSSPHRSDSNNKATHVTLSGLLSHLTCALVAFQIGNIYGAAGWSIPSTIVEQPSGWWRCDCNNSSSSSLPNVVAAATAANERGAASSSNNNNMIGRMTSLQFFERFDLGLPWSNETTTDDVTVLYSSNNFRHDATVIKHINNTLNALEGVHDVDSRCDTLKIVLVGASSCVAVVRQAEAPHVLFWRKTTTRKKQHIFWRPTHRFDPGSHRQDDNHNGSSAVAARPFTALSVQPKPMHTKESLSVLQQYLAMESSLLEDLSLLLEGKVKAAEVQSRTATATSTNNKQEQRRRPLMVLLVCTAGHIELLINFVCAARSVGVTALLDPNKVGNSSHNLNSSNSIYNTIVYWVLATDARTHRVAQSLGLISYHHEGLSASIPNSDNSEYGTAAYAQIMMAKVYGAHLMTTLGYDFVFHDVDIVPYRKDYVEHFVRAAHGTNSSGTNTAAAVVDMAFQFDHATDNPIYQPWSANSGFYYVRCNAKSRYFFSMLLRHGDSILKTKSHQAVLTTLLSEHVSLYGLRVKTLHEESDNFPVGFHFHKNKAYMKKLIQGEIHPYAFHMNWNNDKETKRKFNEQLGDWHVQEHCYAATVVGAEHLLATIDRNPNSCCMAKPVVTCHYRDKPSRGRCDDSPMIEDETSFW